MKKTLAHTICIGYFNNILKIHLFENTFTSNYVFNNVLNEKFNLATSTSKKSYMIIYDHRPNVSNYFFIRLLKDEYYGI